MQPEFPTECMILCFSHQGTQAPEQYMYNLIIYIIYVNVTRISYQASCPQIGLFPPSMPGLKLPAGEKVEYGRWGQVMLTWSTLSRIMAEERSGLSIKKLTKFQLFQ